MCTMGKLATLKSGSDTSFTSPLDRSSRSGSGGGRGSGQSDDLAVSGEMAKTSPCRGTWRRPRRVGGDGEDLAVSGEMAKTSP